MQRQSRGFFVLVVGLIVSLGVRVAASGAQPKGTLTIALGAEPSMLDHQMRDEGPLRYTLNQVSEALVARNPKTMEIVPELAERWERVNETTWRFHLRRGVKFHHGEPFNADTAAFAFNRAWLDNLFAVSSQEEDVRERVPCLQLTNHSNEAMDLNHTLSFYVWDQGRGSGKPTVPEIDEVIVTNRSALDPQARAATYARLMKTIRDQAHAYIALFATDVVHGLSKRLQWTPRLDDLIVVKEMQLTQ